MKLKVLTVAIALGLCASCSKTPAPVVTPQAPTTIDYVKFTLASIQIVADTGCKATPQTVSTKACTAVDKYVPQALADIAAQQAAGWKATVESALTQLGKDLPAADYQPIALYVAIAQAAIAAVPAS